MKKPFVSIILPIYNGASHIEEAVVSIQKNTYKNFETILVDDASADDSKRICKLLAKKYKNIRFFALSKNTGLSNVLNFAIGIAKGKYIARINQDDIMLPSRLEKQVAFLEINQDYVAVGSSIQLFNHEPIRLDSIVFPETNEEIKRHWLYLSPFADPAVMYKKSAFEKTDGYNQEFWPVDDVHMWYQLGKLGKLANSKETLTFVRWHSESGSIKRHRLQVQKLYALHQWAAKNIAKPTLAVKMFWISQLLSGLLLPAQLNWWMFRQLRRLILAKTKLINAYKETFLVTKNLANRKTENKVTTQPIKLSRSGV